MKVREEKGKNEGEKKSDERNGKRNIMKREERRC